jgi:hypothetical protein
MNQNPIQMPTQKNEPNRTNQPNPQDNERRPQATDKNRPGGDAARTQAGRPEDQEAGKRTQPTNKADRR